jgi:TRAP-type mannitol/chloroaromatic compound transport system substrate-binding protein
MMKYAKLCVVLAAVFCCICAFCDKPVLAQSDVIKWKAQSSWIKGPGHQELADYFARMINELSGGRLLIEKMYAAGEMVGAFEAIPAVSQGKLDLAHSSGYYLTGTLRWISLIVGTQANHITYPDEHIAWMYDGGGLELYQDYLKTKYDLVVIPTGIHASEPLWSVKPVTKKEDFKGLKIRSTGLNMAFYQKLGAAVTTMPMGEVIPALERGALDAVEFCVPYTDYPAGLHKVCPYALVGRIHLPCMLGFGAFINGKSWRALPDELKEVVKRAAELTLFRTIHYWNGFQAMKYTEKMIQEGVTINKVTPELQAWFNKIGDDMAEEYAKKDEWAKKILDSQKAFIPSYQKYQGAVAPFFRD